MDELFSGANITQGGAVGILAIVALLVFLGRLVPRRYMEDLREDRDTRVKEIATERDMWRGAYQESEAARQLAQGQVGELIELSRTAGHVLTALPRPAGQGVTAGAPVATTPTAQPS